LLFALLVLLTATTLVACTDDADPTIITSNVQNGDTLTQTVGRATVDLSDISITTDDGTDITSSVVINGTYDLNTIGLYDIELVATASDGTTFELDLFLEIIAATCETDPDLEGCPVALEGFSIHPDSDAVDTILIGEFIKVHFVFSPSNATNQNVHLSSSDETVATVSDYGYVFAQEEGEVTITFTTDEGGFTTSKTYTVRRPTCEEDPYQDRCVYTFLEDDSRVVDLPDANQSGTDYALQYRNNRIYYEIFVRDFADSDGNYVGDFQGIIDNLPYLKQLGVGGIWLMPINETTSPHGYDISDYYAVNPQYGTMAEFEALLAASRAADIDIIMDLVVNHMGAHNAIFQDVLRNGTNSSYYDWFTWIDEDSPRVNETGSWGQTIWYNPSNRDWLKDGVFSIHPTIRNQRYFGYFSDWMPDLNLANPAVVDYIYDVAEYWLDKGVHGFRMDATSHFFAWNENLSITNRDQANIAWLSGFYNHVTTIHPDAYVVTEAWEAANVYIPYFASGVSSFNFQGSYWLKDAANGYKRDIAFALDGLYHQIESYQTNAIDSIFLSNHDMDRVSVALSENHDKMRMAAELLYTTKSNPFVYFGDEVGILGTRTNMIWGEYYSGLRPDFEDRNLLTVSEQLAMDDSLLWDYITLGAVRNQSLALSYGDFIPYDGDRLEGWFRVFDQGDDEELVVVLFNFSQTTYAMVPSEFTAYEILYASFEDNVGGVAPLGTMILRLDYDSHLHLID
jgi:glycosidase